MPSKTIEQVLKDNTKKWMDIPGIEGTAVGMYKDRLCIKIFTSIQPDKIKTMIPTSINGYQVVIEYMGQIHSLEQ